MRTLSSFYIAGFALLAVIFGLLLRSWVLLVLSIPSISILVFGLLYAPPDELQIDINREVEVTQVYEDDEVDIITSFTNDGDAIKYLEVLDEISPRLDVSQGTNHNIFEIGPGETRSIHYKICCPVRGEGKVGPIRLRYRDPFELYTREWKSEEMIKLSILPKIEDIKRVYIRPKYTKNWLGNIRSGAIGVGSEFFALREYQMGDEMKRINWRATARYMHPITNEYEGEQSADVIILIDAGMDSNVGTVERNTNNASIRAAASMAASILEDRNRVGMVILGDFLNWVYPGFGRDQFYEIMDSLCNPSQGGLWDLEDAKWVINRFFPSKSMVIIVSPLVDPKIMKTVVDLWRNEYDLLIVSPSPLAIELSEQDIEDPVAEKILMMERRNLINKLWKYAIVVDWDPNEPLEAALEVVRRYEMRK